MSGLNPYTEQSAIGETANDALVREATRPLKVIYTAKVDELFPAIADLRFTESDFLDLAMAAIDQAGVSLGDQQRIARILGLPDPEES